MRSPRRPGAGLLGVLLGMSLGAGLLVGCGGEAGSDGSATSADDAERTSGPSVSAGSSGSSPSASAPAKPLAGKVVYLDPGHQLGNAAHAAEINRTVDAGGLRKPCNTTGTATDDGFAEATFVWEVARQTERLLVQRGARVVLTRTANSAELWGPCVDERGRAGNPGGRGPVGDVKISLHADGSYAGRGFHVIAPERRAGWTEDIARPSMRLARTLRDALRGAGFPASTYVGADGIDVREDLGTLNLSDIPAVMAELGNMRDATDAAAMRTPAGQRRYARAVAGAVTSYLR